MLFYWSKFKFWLISTHCWHDKKKIVLTWTSLEWIWKRTERTEKNLQTCKLAVFPALLNNQFHQLVKYMLKNFCDSIENKLEMTKYEMGFLTINHLPFLVAIINSSLMATKSEIPPSIETSKARENISGGISSLTNNSSLSRLIDGPGGSTNS